LLFFGIITDKSRAKGPPPDSWFALGWTEPGCGQAGGNIVWGFEGSGSQIPENVDDTWSVAFGSHSGMGTIDLYDATGSNIGGGQCGPQSTCCYNVGVGPITSVQVVDVSFTCQSCIMLDQHYYNQLESNSMVLC
jgi:hypothetical protein